MAENKEVELAKRGVEAFVDRANELHHQGRHAEALRQLQASCGVAVLCFMLCVVARAQNLREKTRTIAQQHRESAIYLELYA